MPDMDVAVGVGRAVVEDEAGPPLGGGAQTAVEVEALPARQDFRLPLRQAGAHRKIGFGQKQRFAVIAGFRRRLVHDGPSNKPMPRRKGLCRGAAFRGPGDPGA